MKGCPSKMAISASFPGNRLPTLSAMPVILAGFIVMASRALYSSIPSFTARAAHTGRYCMGITGWSVIMAISRPAADRMLGVLKVRSLSSYLDRELRPGPTTRPRPSRTSVSVILCPSVQCSMVMSMSNSRAILRAVIISSALWAWALSGSSFLSTLTSDSIFTSSSGCLSSLARSFLSMYLFAFIRASRSRAAVAIRVIGAVFFS